MMDPKATHYHTPVLAREVIHFLQPASGRLYLDGTVGTGGHTEALLRESAPSGRVLGIDADDESLTIARERLIHYGERIILVHARFQEARAVMAERGLDRAHGILLDLGISRVQLEMPCRGFSFSRDDTLDMRMDRSQGLSAAELLSRLSEEEMAQLFHEYGEERWARRIARAVVATRKSRGELKTTRDLVDTILRALPRNAGRRHARIHPATRCFQALRIAVNHELDSLRLFLADLPELLIRGGRCCIIAFHSLEDRIVKNQFREWEGEFFTRLTKKVVQPQREEILRNPLSRSARMRVVERL